MVFAAFGRPLLASQPKHRERPDVQPLAMSRLPPDVLSFLRRADRMLTDAEASASADEEMPQGMRHEVVDNVVQQLAGSELASACHVFGSSALQRAMRLGSIPQRVALATPMLCAAPTHVLTDKYASHVIETILSLVHESLAEP